MDAVMQGQITKIVGNTYVVRTQQEKDVSVTTNELTAHNGPPSVGEYVVVVVQEDGSIPVMTRFAYHFFQAA